MMRSHEDRNSRTRVRLRAALAGLLGILAALAAGDGPALAKDPEVVRATLDNGLRVVIVRNTLAPVATTVMNYLVGGNETPKGFPGMAHAQEHMMFRGSPGLPVGVLADIGSMLGGRFNADTRQSVTQYYFTVPADDLEVALHLEALRMRGVLDTEKSWQEERGAIEQEVARDLSNPSYVVYTKLRAALFRGAPYAHDPLGTRPSFDKTTGAMLKAFHDKWYAPNNAILVVAGDVDTSRTLAEITKLFATIPAKKTPRRPAVALHPVKAASFKMENDLPYGIHVIAFRFPGYDDPDYAAATVLADALGSQRGDLYGLVAKGAALASDFSFNPLAKAGMGYATIAVPEGGDPKSLDAKIREILATTASRGIPAELVAAAKRRELAAFEFQKSSIAGLAAAWSEAVAVEGLNSPDAYLARIERVTPEDVNRVARKYLKVGKSVAATLTPQRSGKPVTSKRFGGPESISLKQAKPVPLPDWAAKPLRRLEVPASTTQPDVSILPNGIKLIVQPEDVSDTVSIYGRVENRPDMEVPKGQEGVSEVLGQLFSFGTESLDRIAFQRALDKIGAEEQAGADFSVEVLAADFDRGARLLADNELHPALPERAFEIVRRQVSQAVAGRLHSPAYLARRAMIGDLFPKDDPTQREALPRTVAALTLKDVRDYYRSTFRPDLTTIVVIGKVTPERAKAVIEKYFGAWTATGPKPDTTLPSAPNNGPAATEVPDASRVQDQVILAETFRLTRSDPDYYPLTLGNTVLGGSFYATRLSQALRENSGLVYYVRSGFEVGKSRGIYVAGYGCDPKNVTKVQSTIVREIEDMRKHPVTADELRMAKAYLLHAVPLDDASIDDIAHGFIERSELDLPLDEPTVAARRYLALGADDVRAAFAKWLRPDDLVRISRGPNPG